MSNQPPSLIEISKTYGLGLREGYQNCPFCKRDNKLRVTGNRYKCFHPDCAKSGDGLDFLVESGQFSSRKDAYIEVMHESAGLSGAEWFRRLRILDRAFSLYRDAIDDEVLDFLGGRGWSQCLETVPFGSAPGDRYLQSKGMALGDLMFVGLAYSSGQEFFRERVIFGIRDKKGQLVHMQGRSTNPNDDLRWLSTPSQIKEGGASISPITNYLFNSENLEPGTLPFLFLAEGVSDTLSLVELGAPAVGCFGVEVSLIRHDLFRRVNNLVVVLDNDTYPLGHEKAGLYKSWTPMLYHLTMLSMVYPKLTIWCCPPPQMVGVKDINDWLRADLHKDATLLSNYVKRSAIHLEEFAIKHYGFRWEFHPTLVRLIDLHKREGDQMALRAKIKELSGDDPLNYAIRLLQEENLCRRQWL